MDEIPIFFTIDDGYVPLLAVALRSLEDNADPSRRYRIIVIGQDLSEESRQAIAAMAQGPFEIEIHRMEQTLDSILDRTENRLRCDYFTMTIYYRIFIPDMFPQYDKGIYIDSDIVVPGDISKLYDVELGDNLLGACPDFAVAAVPELSFYVEEALGVDRHKYINSGVLVMNFEKLREKQLSERFLELLETWHVDCLAPDQDYFNAMCAGQITFLDGRWDVMPGGEEEVGDPWLIHYNLFDTPWCYHHLPYRDYFWKYAAETPYLQQLQDHLEHYPEEQKRSDAASMERLLQKGRDVPHHEVNFKKLYESGVKIRL